MEIFNLRHRLIKNTGIQLAAQVAGILLSLATTFVLSRYLGVVRFGGLNYIFSFYYFFLALGELGVDIIVIRECSQKPEKAAEIIGSMRTFKLCVALISMVIAWLIIWQVDYSIGLKIPLAIYSLILPLIALQLPSVIFRIHLNARYPAMIALGKSIANFIFLIALIASGLGMTGYVLALVLSEIIAVALVFFFSRPFLKMSWKIDTGLCKKVLRSSLVLGSSGLVIAIINRADFIILERMTDLRQVGLYAVDYKFTNLLESFPLMIMATLYPVMSRYARENIQKLISLYRKTLLLFAAISVPMGIVISMFALPIVRFFFGLEFVDAAPGLQALIWATVFLYLAVSGGHLLISMGREKINLLINVAAVILNVGLNFLLIPRYGFVGAAWATVGAYALMFVMINCFLWKILKNEIKNS